MVLQTETFIKVFERMCSYQYKKEVTIDYCHALSFSEEECRNMVNMLFKLNTLSYIFNYEKFFVKTDVLDISSKLHFSRLGHIKRLSVFEMLKAMECIRYNIEIESIPQEYIPINAEKYMRLLKDGIEETQGQIIGQMQEYKDAPWG